MATKSKTQLTSDIAASTFTAPQQAILTDIVDSYQDIFANLTTAQRDALSPAPTDGLMIFNTDTALYEYWNGTDWLVAGNTLAALTVKVDWTAAEIKQSFNISKILVAAPGTGYALNPTNVAWRYTYGTVAFNFVGDLGLIFSTKALTNKFFSIDLTGTSSTSGNYACSTDPDENSMVENDNLTLKAPTQNATTGDGTLTIWLTYSLLPW